MSLEVAGGFLAVPAAVWLGIVVDVAVKGTVVLTAAHLAVRLLPRLPASLACRLWTVAFAILLLLPAVPAVGIPSYGVPGSMLSIIQHGPDVPVASAPAIERQAPAAASDRPVEAGDPEAAAPSSVVLPYWRVPVIAYLLGLLWYGGRTATRIAAGLRAAATARPGRSPELARLIDGVRNALGITRGVRYRISDTAEVPFVAGIVRPVLVLPEAARLWDEERLRTVVLHEIAHIRRRDLLRLVLIELACAVHWFNPLARAGAARARLEAEIACDEAACREGDRFDYARLLVRCARSAAGAGGPHLFAGMAGGQGLERRVRRLLEPESRRASDHGRFPAWGILTLAAVLVLPVIGIRIVAVDTPHPVARETSAPAAARPSPERSGSGIHEAAAAGDTARVDALLAGDRSLLDARDGKGMTPLALAAWNDHPGLVRHLTALGADTGIKNRNGLTPLFCAVDRGRLSTARLLIGAGADWRTTGFRGRTLLHMAARAGDTSLVRDLLDRGAGVNPVDVRGATPSDIAARHGHHEVVALLASRGGVGTGIYRPVPVRRFVKIPV